MLIEVCLRPGVSKMPSHYFKMFTFFLLALRLGRSLIHSFIYSFFKTCRAQSWVMGTEISKTQQPSGMRRQTRRENTVPRSRCVLGDRPSKDSLSLGAGRREEKPSGRRWPLIWDLKDPWEFVSWRVEALAVTPRLPSWLFLSVMEARQSWSGNRSKRLTQKLSLLFLCSLISYLLFRGETEVQRGYVACPKSHSQEVAEAQCASQRERQNRTLRDQPGQCRETGKRHP